MSRDQEWEGYQPPASEAERQGEPVVSPRTPYDDVPVWTPPHRSARSAPPARRASRWRWFSAGFATILVGAVGGLVAIGVVGAAQDDGSDDSIYTMYSTHDYAQLLDDLRAGPGTEVSSAYFMSFMTQLHIPLGGNRTEMYDFDSGEGLKPLSKSPGDEPTFDLARLSAADFLRVCARAITAADHGGDCDITPAEGKDAAAGGWVRVTTHASGTAYPWVVYDRDLHVVRRSKLAAG